MKRYIFEKEICRLTGISRSRFNEYKREKVLPPPVYRTQDCKQLYPSTILSTIFLVEHLSIDRWWSKEEAIYLMRCPKSLTINFDAEAMCFCLSNEGATAELFKMHILFENFEEFGHVGYDLLHENTPVITWKKPSARRAFLIFVQNFPSGIELFDMDQERCNIKSDIGNFKRIDIRQRPPLFRKWRDAMIQTRVEMLSVFDKYVGTVRSLTC